MAHVHTVKPGEHLPAIAAQHGFLNYLRVWDDPANASLKDLRKNPNVLLEGDEVTIPDLEPKSVTRPSGALHRFRVNVPRVLLRLVVRDASGEPVANAECRLTVDDRTTPLATDDQGRLEVEIPATAREGHLVVTHDHVDLDVPLGIGGLDPVEEVTGQIARLNNLGYDAGPVEEPADEEAATRVRSAIEEFQCDHGLKVDGVCGSKSQAKLQEVHGC